MQGPDTDAQDQPPPFVHFRLATHGRPIQMGQSRKCSYLHGTFVVPSILLQKSFWGGGRKFLEPLMRFARGDVRDHIVSFRIDHGPP